MSDLIAVTVKIRKNETGEIVDYPDTIQRSPWGISFYIWEDGNYGCDCNREIFFERIKGKANNEIEVECTEGRYSVQILNMDGAVLYDEFKPKEGSDD